MKLIFERGAEGRGLSLLPACDVPEACLPEAREIPLHLPQVSYAAEITKEGDTITVKMNEHVDYNGKTYPIAALPENLMDIIQAGGLVKAMRKRNGLD